MFQNGSNLFKKWIMTSADPTMVQNDSMFGLVASMGATKRLVS